MEIADVRKDLWGKLGYRHILYTAHLSLTIGKQPETGLCA